MKLRIFLLSLGAVCGLASCQMKPGDKGVESGTGDSSAAVHENHDSPGGVDRGSILMENTVSRQFDGQDGEEVFRVSLLGDSVLSGTIAFTISNGEGELIYSDEFPALMLAATYDESVNTPEKQEALIKERIDAFFEAKRFKDPAIDGDQPPHDSYYVEKATYDNLRETKAPGFVYVIGKENAKYVAWSPLEQKVVMYFNCC